MASALVKRGRFRRVPGLLALVAAVVVGASLPGWLKDRVSHGPFSVTIDTGDRELDGMVVTLFAYAGTMHGNRATYYEQRIARSRERIEFPQQRIQWFGQPRMIVSIDHPLLTGDSYYIPGFRVVRGEPLELGVIEANFLRRYLLEKRLEILQGAAQQRWKPSLADSMLGGTLYSHALRVHEAFTDFAPQMSDVQKEAWKAATDELIGFAEQIPVENPQLTYGQLRHLGRVVENKIHP